jgi:hypothetical protein
LALATTSALESFLNVEIWVGSMNTALKRENPARDKGAHDVICRDLIMLSERHDKPNNPVCFNVGILLIFTNWRLPTRHHVNPKS